MLAIDAARTSGFRDSLYYFRRNPLAMKLNATQWEKDHLIEVGKLGSHLKTRSVTLVTARSAFKLHGSKMLAGASYFQTVRSISDPPVKRGQVGYRRLLRRQSDGRNPREGPQARRPRR